jgi:hypothetical protein
MKRKHGPSLYYATDKNVFDALNQHKVDMPTVLKLFERRNIVVSSKTPPGCARTIFCEADS